MLKKRSGKNLIHFFYHLLVVLFMAMPMLSGLVRIIYVQSNKNAKDSYYGVNEPNSEYVSSNDFSTGLSYQLIINGDTAVLDFTRVSCTFTSIYASDTAVNNALNEHINDFVAISYGGGTTLIFWYADNTSMSYYAGNNLNSRSYIVNFVAESSSYIGTNSFIYVLQYYDFYYLDNAFDYSIWKTLQDFTFHTNFRFTDVGNGMLMSFDNNNLYIQYANFYINWVLTCAVISFAPYVLLSFYHLAIHLLDKFMNKGENL